MRSQRSISANRVAGKPPLDGSQAPMGVGSVKTPTPAPTLEDEFDEINWSNLAPYALNYFEMSKGCTRKLQEILDINRILELFDRSVIQCKRPLIDHPEFNPLLKIKAHMRLIKEGKFAWETVIEDLDELLSFLKTTVSKFFSSFDIDFGHHRLVQVLFPLKLIYLYLARVDRNYGKPVYDKTLRIQNCLAELFLYQHLKADTKFSPKLETNLLPGTGANYRLAVRRINREDKVFQNKYILGEFNLKDIIFQWLDLYFPNVSWRYIGGGQELHRLILQTILTLFELGLWEQADMERLCITLFQKLENLAVLERRSYSDFLTSLLNYPHFINTLKEYFFECKEIVASICLHMVYQTFDEQLVASQSSSTPWSAALGVTSRPFPILFRILTNYLLQFGGDSREDQERWRKRPALRNKIYRICSLAGAETGDEYSRGGLGVTVQLQACNVLEAHQALAALVQQLASPNYEPKDEQILQELLRINKVLRGNSEQVGNLLPDETKRAAVVHKLPTLLMGIVDFVRVRHQEQSTASELEAVDLIGVICCDNELAAFELFSDSCLKLLEAYLDFDYVATALLLKRIMVGQTRRAFHDNSNVIEELLAILQQILSKSKQLITISKADQQSKTAAVDWINEKWTSKVARSPSKRGVFVVGEEATVAGDKSEKISDMEVVSPAKLIDLGNTPASLSLIQELTGAILSHTLVCQCLLELMTSSDSMSGGLTSLKLGFQIQELLVDRYSRFFSKFLGCAEFWMDLPNVQTCLPLEDPSELYRLLVNPKGDLTTSTLNHAELRLLLVHSATATVELLAEATKGLFLHEVFEQCGKEEGLLELLKSSEHLLEVGPLGLRARAAVLKLVTNLLIFPGNGLLSNRLHEFNEGQGSNKEHKIPPSHLNTGTFKFLMFEIENLLNHENKTQLLVQSGYLDALSRLIYKFVAGVYHRYTKDSRLEFVHKQVTELQSKITEVVELFCGDIVLQDEGACQKTRRLDSEEKSNPKLRQLRQMLESCLIQLQRVTVKFSNYDFSEFYSRPCVHANGSNVLEPWQDFSSSALLHEDQKSIWSEKKGTMVTDTPIFSQALNDYLLADYDKAKISNFLQKSESSLLYFLQSSETRIEAFLAFFGRISDSIVFEAITKKEVTPSDPECFQNSDRLQKLYFKSEEIRWYIRFMNKAVKNCPSIQNVYEKFLNSDISAFPQNLTRAALSCMRIWMDNLCSIVLNKTFFDLTYKQLKVEFLHLGEFFRGLTSGNNLQLKHTLNQFAPKIAGIPQFNESQKGMCFNLYVRQETVAVSLDVWKNTSKMLEALDRPEDFDLLIMYARIVAEYCSGPCLANQKEVYKYRGDTWFGIIGRQVENVNSSVNNLRLTVIRGILANLEGKNPDIATYYGSNCTFDHLMDLIYTGLKRLYIYFEYSYQQENKKRLCDLTRESQEDAKTSKKGALLEAKKPARKPSFDYYGLDDSVDILDPTGTECMDEEAEPSTRAEDVHPEIITDQLLKFVKLESAESVLATFRKYTQQVLDHPLFQVSEAMLDLITIISSRVPSFSICLDNANMKLLEKHRADQIPEVISHKYRDHLASGATLLQDKSPTTDLQAEGWGADHTIKEKLLFYLVLVQFRALAPPEDRDARDGENRTAATTAKIEYTRSPRPQNDTVQKIEKFLAEMQAVVELYKQAVDK